jgi:hypothetical protein
MFIKGAYNGDVHTNIRHATYAFATCTHSHNPPMLCSCLLYSVAYLQIVESPQASSKHYTRATLQHLNIKLSDFGRAVLFNPLAAQQFAWEVETPSRQPAWGKTTGFKASITGEVSARKTMAYSPNGMAVVADPGLRPPEVLTAV